MNAAKGFALILMAGRIQFRRHFACSARANFLPCLRNSLFEDLNLDEQSDELFPNKESRAVQNGHFVHVAPTPLPNPFVVSHRFSKFSSLETQFFMSFDMTDKLGIKKSDTESDEFRELFSANISSFPDLKPWATP